MMMKRKWLTLVTIIPLLLLVGCSRSRGETPVSGEETGIFLTVTAPADGSVVADSPIVVEGRTRPEAVVSVNDVGAIADGEGNFAVAVSLSEGANIIEAVASENTGNEARVNLTIGLVKGA
jgi:hypothetical protein